MVEQIVLACLGLWALGRVKGCFFLTASKLRKGSVSDLMALPAPASRTAIGILHVRLLFVLLFVNGRLASFGVCMALHCAMGMYSLAGLYQVRFVCEKFESSKLT